MARIKVGRKYFIPSEGNVASKRIVASRADFPLAGAQFHRKNSAGNRFIKKSSADYLDAEKGRGVSAPPQRNADLARQYSAAIHIKNLTRDETGVLGAQKQDRSRDLFRPAYPAHRDFCTNRFAGL